MKSDKEKKIICLTIHQACGSLTSSKRIYQANYIVILPEVFFSLRKKVNIQFMRRVLLVETDLVCDTHANEFAMSFYIDNELKSLCLWKRYHFHASLCCLKSEIYIPTLISWMFYVQKYEHYTFIHIHMY